MTSSTCSIHVRCDDPAIHAAIRGWLDQTALETPVDLELTVKVVAALTLPDDPRPVFHQPAVEIRTGPPTGDARISWVPAPAHAVIAPGSRRADVVLSHAAVDRLDACIPSFLLVVLVFLLRRAGWHHVHAATTLDPEGRGWLIAGNAHAGKSTTTALLATQRWPVGTDDTAFVASAGDRVAVIGCRGPIALRDGGYELLSLRGGTPLPRRRKTGYSPEELGGSWIPRVEPDLVLFTQVGDAHTGTRPLSPRETLARLIRWSAWVMLEPDLAQEHLDLITRLARQARGFDVTLGRDLMADPRRLLGLVG